MKPLTDEYNITEESQRGQYGFEVFQNKENGAAYFIFVDKDGKAALFSQGYAKLSSRDNGVESVLKNAPLMDRYEIYKEGEGDGQCYYLVLKAANHQQIARSRYEKSLTGINKLRDMCMTIGHTAPIIDRDSVEKNVEAPPMPIMDVETTAPVPEASPANIQSARQKFNLIAYQDNKTIKIEHVISGETLVMQGVSGTEIEAFILRFLPNGWQIKEDENAVSGTSPVATETVTGTFSKKSRMVALQRDASEGELGQKQVEMIENEVVAVLNDAKVIPGATTGTEVVLVMDTPIVSDAKKELPVFSFEKFLLPDGVAPTEEPALAIDRKQVMKVLRTPTPVIEKKEVKESPANQFIKTHVNQTLHTGGKNGTGEDVVLEFATSSLSVEKFLNMHEAANKEEGVGPQPDASPIIGNGRAMEGFANEFIKNGKYPLSGGADSGQVVLTNIVQRKPTTSSALTSTCAAGRPCPVSG